VNKTQIDWTDRTWNPVTGCLGPRADGPCWFCYAKTIAHRFAERPGDQSLHEVLLGQRKVFPWAFDPTIYWERLGEPERLRQRKIRGRPTRVFVGSMGDLFGRWVPDFWVDEVLGVIEANPDLVFQVLTKWPQNAQRFRLPPNVWLGTSVTGDIACERDEQRRVNALAQISASVKFVSLEPLLGIASLSSLIRIAEPDWLIVGALTGPKARTCGLDDEQLRAGADEAIRLSRAMGFPLFFKHNLIKRLSGLREDQFREFPS